jgi:Na+/melibiose symporter-like transporter
VKKKLRWSIKFWFGVGQAAEGLKNSTFNAFLLLFFSQVLGLPAYLAGIALMVGLVIDAVTDPLTGSLSDALEHRWGRRHPFMYAAAIPLWVTFALAFRPPEDMGPMGLFLWMLAFHALARLAMTLYHVPHLALGAELSDDYDERTSVVAYRQFFGLLGGVIVFVLARQVFLVATPEYPNGELDPSAYPPMAMAFGALMAILIFASALGTHSAIPTLPRPVRVERFSTRRMVRELREALQNPSFFWLFSGVLVFFVSRGVATTLDIHMGTFFWRLQTGQVLLIPIAGMAGIALGTPFWAFRAPGYDKKRIFVLCVAWFSVLTFLLPVLKIVGFYPPPESPLYAGLIYTFVFLAAFGAAGSLMVAGSMMADIADEHELAVGRRQEGVFFGALSFSGKAAVGAGSGLAGVGLTLIQFPLQVPPEQVALELSMRLGVLAGPGVAILMFVGALMMFRYELTKDRVAAVQAALAERRAAHAPGEAARSA